VDACKPLPCTCAWYQCVPLAWSDTILYEYANEAAGSTLMNTLSCGESASIRGLHSFPFQLNLSSSVHRIIQIDS